MLRDSGLTDEIKLHQVTFHFYMLWAKGCDPVASILASVNFTAWSHKTGREYSQDTGHYFISTQHRILDMAVHGGAHLGQRLGKSSNPFELLLLTLFDETLMIEI